MLKQAQASAPGSLMLMGEHAVLHGYPAIIQSLPEHIHIQILIAPSPENLSPQIYIHSPLGDFSDSLEKILSKDFTPPKSFEYVLKTLNFFLKNPECHPLTQSISIQITSDFKAGVGLGSSTAVVVALLKALHQSAAIPYESPACRDQTLFSEALEIIRDLQGAASGADIAASLYGGCLFYQAEKAEVLPFTPRIRWKFSGEKVPTKAVIAEVNLLDPEYRENIYQKINQAVLLAKEAILAKDPTAFAENIIKNQKLMEALFLDTPLLKKARQDLELDPSVLATKISGAGLGDGVIGFLGFHP
jgi:mevalonate kinase